MPRQLLILGAGTAGTMIANRLVRALPAPDWQVRVIDRERDHLYQPGLLLLPFGSDRPESLVRPRQHTLAPEVALVHADIDRIDPAERAVYLSDGTVLQWDLLVIATGSVPSLGDLAGLTGPGWRQRQHDFYSLEGAVAVRGALEDLEEGHLVVHLHELPIKCPVAPLEFAFLADAWLRERGRRDRVQVSYVTPLDGAFTRPVAAARLGGLLAARDIDLITDFGAEKVDGEARQLVSYDGRRVDYDLLVSTPLHRGADCITRSGLGDGLGFVPTDRHTLLAQELPGVFVLGDATDLPTSKAGSVAHFQAEVLVDNVLRHVAGRSPLPGFDGHANCFVETGHGKAILLDFNYETEPLPGRFPLPGIGPFELLGESAVNHWGKLGFRWIYWNAMLPGHDLPLDHRMLMAGKRSA